MPTHCKRDYYDEDIYLLLYLLAALFCQKEGTTNLTCLYEYSNTMN